MNAHSFSMMNLCVAFGFAIVNAMGIFGDAISSRGGIFNSLLFLTEPVFSIPGVIEFSGVEALALALAALTVVILNTNLITDKGAAMAIYAVIFYGSVFTIGLAVFKNFDYPGIELFYSAYVLFGSLAFIYYLLQMAGGPAGATD